MELVSNPQQKKKIKISNNNKKIKLQINLPQKKILKIIHQQFLKFQKNYLINPFFKNIMFRLKKLNLLIEFLCL